MSEEALIDTDVFWSYAKVVYPMEANWHLLDHRIQKITKKEIGLEFIETAFKPESQDIEFRFKIVDRKKYAFAKIKYGI